ncbi:hypothetical protein HDU98_004281 [Podochytrium sp. JEL0797]|nr:hypothetical protein HDU98_004281 [Podochytrium sp. JEL0797]
MAPVAAPVAATLIAPAVVAPVPTIIADVAAPDVPTAEVAPLLAVFTTATVPNPQAPDATQIMSSQAISSSVAIQASVVEPVTAFNPAQQDVSVPTSGAGNHSLGVGVGITAFIMILVAALAFVYICRRRSSLKTPPSVPEHYQNQQPAVVAKSAKELDPDSYSRLLSFYSSDTQIPGGAERLEVVSKILPPLPVVSRVERSQRRANFT